VNRSNFVLTLEKIPIIPADLIRLESNKQPPKVLSAGYVTRPSLHDYFESSHLSRQKAAILEAAGARLCIVDVAKANLACEAAGPKAEQTPSRDKAKTLDRRRRLKNSAER
jgi:hypothetical protein